VRASSTSVRRNHHFTLSGKLVAANKAVLSKQTVKIYFSAKGSGKWVYAGSATTDRHAAFARVLTAKANGSWRATYAGAGGNLGSTGKSVYVHVS
jgi:hypothetical protein